MMWFLSRSQTVSPFEAFLALLVFDVLKEGSELRQWIVGADIAVKLPPSLDQIARDLQLLFAMRFNGSILLGHNRRIQTSFHRVMKKNRIEHYPRCRIQTK